VSRKSSLNKIQPINLPCKKTIYNSPEEAGDMISYLMQNKGARELYPYKCMICGFWHLTSKPR